VPFVVGAGKEIFAVLDRTDFDDDDQATIALHMLTSHGRATPVMWSTVKKSDLKNRRNEFEDDLLERFKEVLPKDVKVTMMADRGFGDQKLYQLLTELGFDYIIRFRDVITVTDENGESRPAADWVPSNGRALMLKNAQVRGCLRSSPPPRDLYWNVAQPICKEMSLSAEVCRCRQPARWVLGGIVSIFLGIGWAIVARLRARSRNSTQ
jgi:hypothetical protein